MDFVYSQELTAEGTSRNLEMQRHLPLMILKILYEVLTKCHTMDKQLILEEPFERHLVLNMKNTFHVIVYQLCSKHRPSPANERKIGKNEEGGVGEGRRKKRRERHVYTHT